MKQIIHNLYLKYSLTLAILFIISLIIWFGGPYINIADNHPLQYPEKRLYIISLLYLAWIIIVFSAPTKNNATETAPKSPEALQKLEALRKRFAGAITFLKKTSIEKLGKKTTLAHLPWYLIIGPSGAGKTTLLAKANLHYILAKQFKDKINPSETCDWWVTRESVLVDVPGSYLAAKNTTTNFLWNNLLTLIKKFPHKQTLSVVIALPFPELIKQQNQQQKKQLLVDIKNKITELHTQFGNRITFNIVVTKCDLLKGFTEFFGELSADELAQAWGITIPTPKENEKLLDVFSTRFNMLIKRLNKQLISRLHHERNANARPYIKDFPLQVERLKDTLQNFIKALAIPDLCLHGVYLTSSTQNAAEEPSSQPQIINQNSQQALQLLRNPVAPVKAYFIRHFILQGLLSDPDHHGPQHVKSNVWQQRAIYAASIAAIISAVILLGRDFQRSVLQTYAIQNNLVQYQLAIQQSEQQGDRLLKSLPLLNSLQAAAIPTNTSLSRLANILTFYSTKSQKTASAVYYEALQKIIIPEIKNCFENYLRTANDKNPVQLYAVLKAYLMLNNPTTFKADFVVNTVNQLIPTHLNPQISDDLANHLAIAFAENKKPLDLDAQLITQVRNKLTGLSSAELSFVILKNLNNNSADSTLNLGTNLGDTSVFVSHAILHQIPNMFTADKFQEIISREIYVAATEALQGNWILGNSEILSNEATINHLADQLRTNYVANYVDIWESLLANLKLEPSKSLAQTNAMVANLMSNTSPLIQLLQTIRLNTSFGPIVNASPKIQMLSDLLVNASNNQQNSLYQIFVDLRGLHTYLQNILNTNDIGKAAFDAAKNRMQDSASDPITQLHLLAEQNPEPMKSWLNTLASQSWEYILQETSHHIANAWQINITSIYNAQIANRFPFKANATAEVDLQEFTSFFGTQGTLLRFYQQYFKPFANESEQVKHWRVVDNQKLPFSEAIFTQIQFAEKLQHAFFPNGDNKLYVQFSLEPLGIDKDLKSIHLNINGQKLTYQKAAPRDSHVLSWPGINNSHMTKINFISPTNQLSSVDAKGDWGWFRIVNQSTKEIMSNKQLLLNFNLNGHAAKYMLFTQGRLNPFLPLNLQRFKLPEELG